MSSQLTRSVATYSIVSTVAKISSAMPRSVLNTRTPSDRNQATMIGPRSRARGRSTPSTRLPAVVNSSRFSTRIEAKNTMSRILANSPGWMVKPGRMIQFLAPLISENRAGSTAGIASSTSPTKPVV